GGAVGLGHVLAKDFDRLGSHHEQGAEVTNQRRQDVLVPPPLQGKRRGNRFALLAEGAEQPAEHLGLAIQRYQTLFQRPGQPEVIVDFEQLVGRQRRAAGGGHGGGGPSRRKSHGPKL